MAINQQGIGLPYPSTTFPTTVGTPPYPQFNRTNQISLQPGGVAMIPPGWVEVDPGKYSVVQTLDPVTQTWKQFGLSNQRGAIFVNSDGFNFRVVNPLGCVVAVKVTAGGDGYAATETPAVTFSSGGAVASAIVGGAVGTIALNYVSGAVTSGAGDAYTYRPTIAISAPPAGGIQATAIATISGDTFGTTVPFLITNQGAGYDSAPTVTIIPHPADPNIGSIINATAVATLTGAASVTGVLVTNYGRGVLGGSPAVTIAAPTGGGTQATGVAITALTIMSATVTAAGSNFGAGTFIQPTGGYETTATAFTNPDTQGDTFYPRAAVIAAVLASGAVTALENPVRDGGVYQVAPTLSVVGSPGVNGGQNIITGATVTANMGAVPDTVQVINIGGNG